MQKIIYVTAATLMACFLFSCGKGGDKTEGGVETVDTRSVAKQIANMLKSDSVSDWTPFDTEMPEANARIETMPLGDLKVVFNDSNHVHWSAASKIGIDPITDTRSHWHTRQPLVKITSCKDFYVDELTHSAPYLVPAAASMVHDLGRRFSERVHDRSGANYRMKVTSVLRTPQSVRRLRRVNKNSVDSSVHMAATTIDISYAGFICDDPRVTHSREDLKAILAEVINEMRDEGRLYVKYEFRQPCFHITCRK